LKIVSVVQPSTVEERANSETPEPANNASATVLGGDDLQALARIIDRGLQDSEAGHTISNDEMKRQMDQWRK